MKSKKKKLIRTHQVIRGGQTRGWNRGLNPDKIELLSRQQCPVCPVHGLVSCGKDPAVSPVYASPEVVGILTQIDGEREDRREAERTEALQSILGRVDVALRHAGLSLVSSPTQTFLSQGPARFDVKAMRQELSRKNTLLEAIGEHSGSLQERNTLLTELGNWLSANTELGIELASDEEMEAQIREIVSVHREIKDAIDVAFAAASKIKDIGYVLLKEAGALEAKDKQEKIEDKPAVIAQVTKTKRVPPKAIIEDKILMADPRRFQQTCLDIQQCMEESVKLIRGPPGKNELRSACKQYRFVLKAFERRMADLKNKEEEVLTLHIKVDQLTRTSEKAKAECAKLERKNNSLDAKILRVQADLKGQIFANEDMKSEIAELREQKEELAALMAKKSEPKTVIKEVVVQEPVPHLVAAAENTSSQETSLELITLKEELEQYQQQLQLQMERADILEKTLVQEKEKASQMAAKLENYEGMSSRKADMDAKFKDETMAWMKTLGNEKESLARQLARLKSELNCKNELVQHQERSIRQMKEDLDLLDLEQLAKGEKKDGPPVAPDLKRTIQRLQKDFVGEINRLKAFVEKEKLRHAAVLRKMEQSHKEQMLGIHKQSIHLLRAINRFKESVAVILDRESLPLAASQVRRIPNLSTDESPSDAKMLLAQMAGTAVELLVTVEFKLSQALMNKRLEIKDNSIARSMATKDLEAQTDAAQKAKQVSELLTEKMRETKAKLDVAESALTEVRKFEDARYTGLTGRYRSLMKQYTSVQKELTQLQKDYKDVIKSRKEAMKNMLKHKRSMARLMEEQQIALSDMQHNIDKKRDETQKKLAFSIADQKVNLTLLEEAFRNNKISRQMYSMTKELVKQATKLPLARLRQLFERYVAYRAFRDAQNHLKRQLKNTQLPDSRKSELMTFLQRMDSKLEKSIHDWHIEQGKLEHQRKDLLHKMASLFSEVIVETGVLLIPPDSNQTRPKSASTAMTKSTVASKSSGYSSGSSRFPPFTRRGSPEGRMPKKLVGTPMPLVSEQEAVWHLPEIIQPPLVLPTIALTTPRIVDLEVNQKIREAQKALKKARKRQTCPMSKAENVDFAELQARLIEEVKKKRSAELAEGGEAPSDRESMPAISFNKVLTAAT